MDLATRRLRYKAIEDYRKRPLIVFATSTRGNVRALIAGDVVREFIDQVDAIEEGDAVDVLIHSTGGDALTAWKLMAVLRERFGKVGVLVPSMAFSAATIFALGADEIVMHPHASLGPIDPQITVRLPDGSMKQFAYEDLGAFLKFLREEVQLSEQAHLSAVVDRLFASTDPVAVGAAKRAASLAAEVGERLLSMHMKDDRKARQIAQNLAKSFFAHGDAVSRKRAMHLELQIAKPDTGLEKLIWDAFLGLEDHMQLRKPFHPLEIFLSDPVAALSIEPVPPVQLPPNMPADLSVQVWQQTAQMALQKAAAGSAVKVPYSVLSAVVESVLLASENRTSGTIAATRQADGEVAVSVSNPGASWLPVTSPPEAAAHPPDPSAAS
jgi:hypothetical protein